MRLFCNGQIGITSSAFFLCLVCSYCLPDGDLCKWMNGRKYYIDVGESGIISVENVTSQTKGESSSSQPQIPQRCSVELITCPSCHFEVTILHLNIPTCSSDNTCRCDFVWVKEAAYSKSGQEYCGFKANDSSQLLYESKTKLVSIDFLYSGTYKDAFALQFSAKKNVYVFKGGLDYYQSNSTGFFQSPNFPGGYPSDYSAEFVLQNVETTGFVQLLFTDFQLSLWSYMEVFDSNGSRIDVYNGNTFRPPALMSSGPTMTVKFQANDEYPSSGFRVKFTFVSYPEKYWINRPSTDCGGFVEDYGGAITMMNMVPGNVLRAYDCIWLIRPRNTHVVETHTSIRVAQFEEMGPKSTLTIRQGLHSEAPLLESVTTFQHHKMPRGQEYVVPASSGFYIRLVGFFNNKSHLAIIYTSFRYDGCYSIGDYECENGRCIKSALRCDGFNHCGDGSDEASCYGANQGTPSPEDANWWRTLTPNYYFPKSDSNTSPGTNTLILVTSLAGLGMFVLTTVMILVKLHRQRQDDSISREILHTISGDIDSDNSPSHHILSDPPLYDPPPSYEDVIKFYLPPPPAYSSIARGRNCGHHSESSGGVDNAGFVSDSPTATRESNRRNCAVVPSRSRQEPLQPIILRVSLPSEQSVGNLQAASSAKYTATDANTNNNSEVNSSTQNCLLTENASSQQSIALDLNSSDRNCHSINTPAGVHCSSNNSVQYSSASHQSKSSPQNKASGFKEPIKLRNASHYKNNNQSTESKNNKIAKSRNSSEEVSVCECQGACSCPMSGRKQQIDKRGSGNKADHVSKTVNKPQRVDSSEKITKKQNFKNCTPLQCSSPGSHSIIPHPSSMVITVKPSRSRSFEKNSNTGSQSAGPSSPSFMQQSNIFKICDKVRKSSSSPRMGHRRVSSGPSEISTCSLAVSKSPKGVNGSKVLSKNCAANNTQKLSKPNVSEEMPNLSHVRSLASVLFDGLHQSFSLRVTDADLGTDAVSNLPQSPERNDISQQHRIMLPVNWRNLWNPVKRRSEKSESSHVGVENSWSPTDTQPLLRRVASQPGLLTFDDTTKSHKHSNSDVTEMPNDSKHAKSIRSDVSNSTLQAS